MDFMLKVMDFVLKLMDFMLKVMDFQGIHNGCSMASPQVRFCWCDFVGAILLVRFCWFGCSTALRLILVCSDA